MKIKKFFKKVSKCRTKIKLESPKYSHLQLAWVKDGNCHRAVKSVYVTEFGDLVIDIT